MSGIEIAYVSFVHFHKLLVELDAKEFLKMFSEKTGELLQYLVHKNVTKLTTWRVTLILTFENVQEPYMKFDDLLHIGKHFDYLVRGEHFCDLAHVTLELV